MKDNVAQTRQKLLSSGGKKEAQDLFGQSSRVVSGWFYIKPCIYTCFISRILCLCVYRFIGLGFIGLSVYWAGIYRFIGLSGWEFIGLSVYRVGNLSVYRFIGLGIYRFIGLSGWDFIGLSVYRFIGLSALNSKGEMSHFEVCLFETPHGPAGPRIRKACQPEASDFGAG